MWFLIVIMQVQTYADIEPVFIVGSKFHNEAACEATGKAFVYDLQHVKDPSKSQYLCVKAL